MHCTWFNEKKKSSFPPYIFLWVFFPSPNTSPHLSPSPAPHTASWGRSAPARPEDPAGHLRPGPSWPAASDLARAGAHRPGARHSRLSSTEGAHAAGQGPPTAPLRLRPCLANPTEKSLHFDRASRPARPAPHPRALLPSPRTERRPRDPCP
jgi:hypothetical protein